MATPICSIGPSGIYRPTLADCLSYFAASYSGIYGPDTVLSADTQDGELLGLLASTLNDVNAQCVSAYNSFSPATAQGTGLSSVVKINGIAREIPTTSTIPALIVGPQGTTITNGLAVDPNNLQWALPASVVIPASGQITVTLTCQTEGAINLSAGSTMTPVNPTRGWQSTITTAPATPGAPVETDAQLRLRQSNSTTLPSQGRLDSISAALWKITGVQRLRVYQNDQSGPDTNGLPGHSIAVVIDGGDASTIANAIYRQIFACGTYGTTSETITDAFGIPHPINFFYISEPEIQWQITVRPAPNYSVATADLISQSLAAYTNALGIGQSIQISRVFQAAYLGPLTTQTAAAIQTALASGDTTTAATLSAQMQALNAAASTYEVVANGISVRRAGGSFAASDLTIAFNEAASIVVDGSGRPVNSGDVTVIITT